MPKKTLIIGAGGVASVAVHKCCQNSEIFPEIMIASRTKAKCDRLAEEATARTGGKTKITTAQIDAMDVAATAKLIKEYGAELVLK
jgi:saccharopine dehydrogenase (NAD+, L-lysine-forming)